MALPVRPARTDTVSRAIVGGHEEATTQYGYQWAGRYERRPTIITSNKSLTEWGTLVQDMSLAAAIVDRLLHHGQVFYLKGPSWRTKDRPPTGVGTEEAAG